VAVAVSSSSSTSPAAGLGNAPPTGAAPASSAVAGEGVEHISDREAPVRERRHSLFVDVLPVVRSPSREPRLLGSRTSGLGASNADALASSASQPQHRASLASIGSSASSMAVSRSGLSSAHMSSASGAVGSITVPQLHPSRLVRTESMTAASSASGTAAVAVENGRLCRKKSNSTSTLYVDSTINQPIMSDVIRCVSLAIYYQIAAAQQNPAIPILTHIFSTTDHPLGRSPITDKISNRPLDWTCVHTFVDGIFSSAQLTAEVAIVSLIYIERLVETTKKSLHPTNWQRIVLGAIMLASKVWDDQAVWNADFVNIFPNGDVDDLYVCAERISQQQYLHITLPPSLIISVFYMTRIITHLHHHPQARAPFKGLMLSQEPVGETIPRVHQLQCERGVNPLHQVLSRPSPPAQHN
jgi:hypothetical protein